MKITVFTPTFNRGYIIERLYRSLQRQSFRDFEWIVVDDGSTDNTSDLVSSWMGEKNFFNIFYYKTKNGGKSRAINLGLDHAQGELFFTVDSDDYLTNDALEKVVYWEGTIAGLPGFCGVAGNRGTSETETPNRPFTSAYRDAFSWEQFPEASDDPLDGERADVYYTEIFRQFKYPEFEGENYLIPCVPHLRMANAGYKIRFFPDIIWVCKYLDDGLTMQGNMRFIKNPMGAGLCLREKAAFLRFSLLDKMKMWYTFYCDHTFCEKAYRLTKRQCAEYIGAPLSFVWLSACVHRISHGMKWFLEHKRK